MVDDNNNLYTQYYKVSKQIKEKEKIISLHYTEIEELNSKLLILDHNIYNIEQNYQKEEESVDTDKEPESIPNAFLKEEPTEEEKAVVSSIFKGLRENHEEKVAEQIKEVQPTIKEVVDNTNSLNTEVSPDVLELIDLEIERQKKQEEAAGIAREFRISVLSRTVETWYKQYEKNYCTVMKDRITKLVNSLRDLGVPVPLRIMKVALSTDDIKLYITKKMVDNAINNEDNELIGSIISSGLLKDNKDLEEEKEDIILMLENHLDRLYQEYGKNPTDKLNNEMIKIVYILKSLGVTVSPRYVTLLKCKEDFSKLDPTNKANTPDIKLIEVSPDNSEEAVLYSLKNMNLKPMVFVISRSVGPTPDSAYINILVSILKRILPEETFSILFHSHLIDTNKLLSSMPETVKNILIINLPIGKQNTWVPDHKDIAAIKKVIANFSTVNPLAILNI